MKNCRTWGKPPYNVAVVHGGPGMPGSVAPLARELSTVCGVLEPLQSKKTLNEQTEELRETLETYANLPVTVIGWSHGSGLSCLLASRHPNIVKKLIVIGTSPFQEKYQAEISNKRLLRLTEKERADFYSLARMVQDTTHEKRSEAMASLVRLATKADFHSPLSFQDDVLEYHPDVMISIGQDWTNLFHTGRMMELAANIKCPVVAIQGDYDVNPAELVEEQFSQSVKDFRFVTLEKCGHTPWYEKYARDEFFKIIKEEASISL